MKIVEDKVTLKELVQMAQESFGNLVKAVVDVEKEVMVVDAELHADQEALLLKNGSKQKNLWGINLYPELYGTNDFVEFDSMINLRPNQNNMSRGVESESLQELIINIVKKRVQP